MRNLFSLFASSEGQISSDIVHLWGIFPILHTSGIFHDVWIRPAMRHVVANRYFGILSFDSYG
jgi:hypothetical protein